MIDNNHVRIYDHKMIIRENEGINDRDEKLAPESFWNLDFNAF